MEAVVAPKIGEPPGGKPVNHWMVNGPVPFAVTLNCVDPPAVMLVGCAVAAACCDA